MLNSKKNWGLRSALLASVALVATISVPGAGAQPAAPAPEKKVEKVEKVVVTGTAIRGNLKVCVAAHHNYRR